MAHDEGAERVSAGVGATGAVVRGDGAVVGVDGFVPLLLVDGRVAVLAYGQRGRDARLLSGFVVRDADDEAEDREGVLRQAQQVDEPARVIEDAAQVAAAHAVGLRVAEHVLRGQSRVEDAGEEGVPVRESVHGRVGERVGEHGFA